MALFYILLTVSGEINSNAKDIKYFKGTATAVDWGPVRDHATIRFYLLLKKPLNEDAPSSLLGKEGIAVYFFIHLIVNCLCSGALFQVITHIWKGE